MSQTPYQALDDDRRLPWPEAMGKATIRARFMLAYADADADALPDAHAPRGTVTLTYAGSGYRWTDADGSRLVAALPVVCPILPDGTLGSPDHNLAMNGRVIIMPTEVAGLEPAGSTVTATIRIANAQAKFEPVTFTVKPDDDINLAELVSVQSTPGVVTVVDDTIAVRAEAAANRAEDAASDVGGALTQITAATETVQTLSDNIMTTADGIAVLEESAAESASIAETARDETQTLLTTLEGAPRLTNELHDMTWQVQRDATIHSQTPRTVEVTATARDGHIRWSNLIQLGTSYYFTAEVKTTSDQVFLGPTAGPVYHSGSGNWERLTGTVTPLTSTYFRVQDNRSSGWDQIEVRDPVLIDLTAAFGAGREPNKEYMDALLAKHGNYIGAGDQFVVGDALRALTVAGAGMGLRLDNSVGTRVVLDHPGGTTMLYGDTGWRRVTDLLINGWEGTVLYRRINNDHILSVYELDPTNATATQFLSNIPNAFVTGWRGATFTGGMSWTRLVAPTTYAWVPSERQYGELRWSTATAWPTTLPGLPR